MISSIRTYLDALDRDAKEKTTCTKTWVGACLGYIKEDHFYGIIHGFNTSDEWNCRLQGEYKDIVFGKPEGRCRDWCKAVHAEENAILKAIKSNSIQDMDTIVVTRYPCEKCAALIAHHGIKNVFYGRQFEISEETKQIFNDSNINVVHIKDWESGDKHDTNK
jgi:dCMP deaminase